MLRQRTLLTVGVTSMQQIRQFLLHFGWKSDGWQWSHSDAPAMMKVLEAEELRNTSRPDVVDQAWTMLAHIEQANLGDDAISGKARNTSWREVVWAGARRLPNRADLFILSTGQRTAHPSGQPAGEEKNLGCRSLEGSPRWGVIGTMRKSGKPRAPIELQGR